MNLDKLLEMSENKLANEFESYEGSEFEEFNYEVENALMSKFNPRVAKQMAKTVSKAVYSPARQLAQKQIAMAQVYGGGLPSGIKRLAAQFTLNAKIDDLQIDPLTGLVPSFKLPVPLFGFLEYINNYQVILASVNPSNGSYLVSSNGSEVTFTYFSADGITKIAKVVLSCLEYPYVPFLYASQNNLFNMSKVRMSLSDATKLQQFNTIFKPRYRSMFGIDNSDTLTINSQKSPLQFQNGIIDIDGDFRIDAEKSLMTAIDLSAGKGFEVSYSMFVEMLHPHRMR